MATKYTIMVVDGGGRGAVLVEKYSQSPQVGKIIAVPGNDLMQANSKKLVKIYPELTTSSVQEIIKVCKEEKVDLVDVAQDAAVEVGVTDVVEKIGIAAVGPSRLAGQIEWDKAWARRFMAKYDIPHPQFRVFDSQKDGINFIKKQKEGKWFVKANGLVDGKGALPANRKEEAIDRIKEMQRFGKQGETYLIEDWLVGEEFSYFVVSDGKTHQFIGCAQDHKRMFNFDEGENTGGMGCSAPPLLLTRKLIRQVDKRIIRPTLDGLRKEGRPFKGILYLGGIVVNKKPYVIEFNARWGDPEAQVLVPSIKTDLLKISLAVAKQKLHSVKVVLDNKYRVVVILALRKNPTGEASKYGRQVFGIDQVRKLKSVRVYNTRLKLVNGKYYASTGRQLCIMAEGRDVIEARQRAYEAASLIYIEGNNLHYRTDIGWRDVDRLTKLT